MRAGTFEVIEAFVAANGIKFGPGSQYRPGAGSFHGRGAGQARDFGMYGSDAHAISRLFRPIAVAHPELIPEVFGSDGFGIDEGRPYQAPGHTDDHTHVAIHAGVTLEQLAAANTGAPIPAGGPTPATPGTPAPGAGAGAATGPGAGGSFMRKALVLAGGVGILGLGLALMGIDLGAVGKAAGRAGRAGARAGKAAGKVAAAAPS